MTPMPSTVTATGRRARPTSRSRGPYTQEWSIHATMGEHVTCASCGAQTATGNFCNACGANLTVVCVSCRVVNVPGSSYCSGCGVVLASASVTEVTVTAPPPVAVPAPAVMAYPVAPAPVVAPVAVPAVMMNAGQALALARRQVPYEAPSVGFGEAISAYWRGYVVWNARSTRAEYWWIVLFTFLVALGCMGLDLLFGMGLLSIGWFLATFLPNLSLVIRRLHDTDRSGAWYWFALIPFVGGFLLGIPVMFFRSVPFESRWNRSLVSERKPQLAIAP